jgi:gamma-glutamyltranspeptidase / glutathione hydrolase
MRYPKTGPWSLLHPSLLPLLLLTLSCSPSGPPVSEGDVVAERAMVASAHPAASAAGLEILRQGGNAVDAAVAVAFALSIAEPNASGIGGGGYLMVKLSDQPDLAMIDYREAAPGRATPDYYYAPDVNFGAWTSQGPNAVGVPGLVAGAALALERFGTMTLAEVLQPAIRLCREGIEVTPLLSGMILDNYDKIDNFPAAAAIYLPDGLPLEPGDILRNEDLALTLEKIAAGGPSVFYEGEIAEAMVAELQSLGGVFELDDLKSYQAKVHEPVSGNYRGYQIFSASGSTGGGTHLIQLLNIMEGFDVRGTGFGSASYLHSLAEAMKMIFADKAANSGDPDFYALPSRTFTDKTYARQQHERIREGEARFDYGPPSLIAPHGGSTSHLSVVDAQGNLVALTQSINSFFGSGVVVPGTGILLNNHLADFDSQPGGPNAIGPGRRPTSSMAPTLVFHAGEPFLTVGSPGATRIISALAQIIINLVDFDMGLNDAIEAPRIHALGRTLSIEGRMAPEVVESLQEWGHTVRLYPDWDSYFGGAQGILVDARRKRLYGAADSRRDGSALGY